MYALKYAFFCIYDIRCEGSKARILLQEHGKS